MRFIDREAEMEELGKLRSLSERKLFAVAIYGIRRVGKTRLALEFLKDGGTYFFVNRNKRSPDLLREYEGVLRGAGMLGELERLDSWDAFIDVIVTRARGPVVIDEFQNFHHVEPSVFGTLQHALDTHEDTPGCIVLLGSVMGLVRRTFEDRKEPLYGRVKRALRLRPLSLTATLDAGRELGLSREDAVTCACIFGGYPKYYVAIEDFALHARTAEDIIDALLLSPNAPLEDEVNLVLSQEFGRRGGRYYSVLEAIANGCTTLSSIASYMHVPPTSITRHIKELRDYFELIGHELPFEGRRGIYRIAHPLLRFWFANIHRNLTRYVARDPSFIEGVRKGLPAYIGRAFEPVAREFVIGELDLSEARGQWGKVPGAPKGKNTYAIDLIGRSGTGTYAFEFKWRSLDVRECHSILAGLKTKASLVRTLPADTRFGIVARRIRGKGKLRDEGALVYDIDDF